MMSPNLIEEYARVARNRLPGETWAIAALRMVIDRQLSAQVAFELSICKQERNGIRAAKVFLPNGAELRTKCAKCGHIVNATIGRGEVRLLSRVERTLESARRLAIWECKCARRGASMCFYGRPVLQYWELQILGRWVRIHELRMPWD